MEVTIYKKQDSKYYQMNYYEGGIRRKKSTKATTLKLAKKIAQRKQEELLRSIGIEDPDNLLFSHLIDEVISDYKINNKRSKRSLLQRRKPLLIYFTTDKNINWINRNKDNVSIDHLIVEKKEDDDDDVSIAVDAQGNEFDSGNVKLVNITEMDIEAYKKWRNGKNISNATINRELAIVKRGFSILKAQRRIAYSPKITSLEEGNVRQGFFEKWEVVELLKKAPDYLAPIIKFAYKSGWRKEEILSITWDMVDMAAEEINLPPTLAKNKQGRKYPLVDDELKTIFRQFWNNRAYVEQKSPYVFLNKDGIDRIKYFRKAWEKACTDSKIGKKLFHDFRRTCVRNLVREGTPEKIAMQITGHKTRKVFEAYNIVSVEDMRRAIKRQEEGLNRQSDTKPLDTDKPKIFEGVGIIKTYPGKGYIIPIKGDMDPEAEGTRPSDEVMAEIVEEYKNKDND
jgi:integrase